jgi:hypothetical protein
MGELLEVGAEGEGKGGLAVEGAVCRGELGGGGSADGCGTEGEVAGLETGRGSGVDDGCSAFNNIDGDAWMDCWRAGGVAAGAMADALIKPATERET